MKHIQPILFTAAALTISVLPASATIVTLDAAAVGAGFNGGAATSSNFAGATTAFVAGEADSLNFFRGFAFFDVSAHTAEIAAATSIDLRFDFASKFGSVFPLNLDYLGTVSTTTIDNTLWSQASAITVSDALNDLSPTGIYDFGFDTLAGETLSQTYAVFRFNPTHYDRDGSNRQYNFSTTLSDTQLVLDTIPEPSRALLSLIAIASFTLRRRRPS